MSAGRDWINQHLAEVPPDLLETMLRAIPDDAHLAVPQALASGALDLYASVSHGSGGREDALPLLAGDALLTHAFEAQAMTDPAGLGAFAREWGAPGALGRVPLP